MKRRVIIVLCVIILVILMISYNIYVNFHNKKTEEQRLSIFYCNQDEDCVMQNYKDYYCHSTESGCYNKNEKPVDDIVFKFERSFGRHCDPIMCPGEYPTYSCKCINGSCQIQCSNFVFS